MTCDKNIIRIALILRDIALHPGNRERGVVNKAGKLCALIRVATGSASGNDSCAGNNASFTATFSAASATEPSYLDQRPPLPTPRSVCNPPDVSSAINLLLFGDDEE